MPSSFGQELGMQKDRRGSLLGTRALVLAGGEAAVLRWPLTSRIKLREPIVDARWLAPGYKPPAWGRDPPAVAPEIAGSLPKSGEQTDKPKKPAQEQTTTVTTVATDLADLPTLPGQQGPQEALPTDRVTEGVLEHLLDAAAPGAALAARILGLVADTAPATPTGQPTQTVMATVTKRQGQEAEAEHEPDENDRDE